MSDEYDQVKEALEFAQRLAKYEIENIERLHNRTISSFKYIAAIVVAALALVGWVGYTNLKNAAIATAESQMKKEVTAQVQDKLTKENINQIVQDQIRDYSSTTLDNAIHKELSSPPLSTSIREAGADEARQQIKRLFSPRHFSDSQSKAFISYVADTAELDGYPVKVVPAEINEEAMNYASEISKSISLSKLKVFTDYANVENQPGVDGVGIYRDQMSPEKYAQRLQDAFAAAGVKARIVSGIMQPPTPKGEKAPLVIYVGPKSMQQQ